MKPLSHWLLFCLCAILAPLNYAAPSDPLFASNGSLDGSDRFLPVEQAYRINAQISAEKLILDWQIAPGYYLYKKAFQVSLPDGGTLPLTFDAGTVVYDEYFEEEVEVYYGTTRITASLPETDQPLTLKIASQGCADAGLCYPPRTQYLSVDTVNGTATEIAAPPTTPSQASGTKTTSGISIPLALGFALIGGFILNLMPCVFPVLSVKVLSLTQSHLSAPGRHRHGLAYAVGIISAFTVFALLLTALRASGEALGWGFQLQSPMFITSLVVLFFVMGLSFSGYLEAGARFMGLGQSVTHGQGLRHSFMTGVLAAVVASPCTAPFMGTALGAALTQPPTVSLLIFIGLGLGMALPFLLLTWIPGLMRWLPKPGPWMTTFKEALAFPLYLTCVWLIWVLGNQAGSAAVATVLAGLTLIALALWAAGKATTPGRLVAVIALVGALVLLAQPKAPGNDHLWEPYSRQRLDSLLASGQPVFINLTADWCITCLANERVALSSEAFQEALKRNGVVYLKGDWTNQNPEITELLNANERNGVPLYLYYPPGNRTAVVLPQILTKGLIVETLNRDR